MFSADQTQVSSAANYIEDVFSTYLYTGTAASQPITNGIDLAGKGGLVWTKQRDTGSYQDHVLLDTARGLYPTLCTNNANAQFSDFNRFTSWNSNGYTLSGTYWGYVNEASKIYVSWTFRKQPKFFDVVTYTGDGATTRTISHNLGSTPGFVIIKNMDSTGNWMCWHNSFAATDYIALNTTGAKNYAGTYTDIYKGVSSTTVTIGSNGVVNNSGYNYVMYVFAHNAGGFGLTGTDNVISCGSFTQPSSGDATITLGYEPQWVMIKRTDAVSNWFMYDIMRGMSQTTALELLANTAAAEGDIGGFFPPTATGFISKAGNLSAGTYIYIAIRRGPMKTPTSGTSVFSPTYTSSASNPLTVTTGFPVDLSLSRDTSGSAFQNVIDRLRGGTTSSYNYLTTQTTNAEATGTGFGIGLQSNTGIVDNSFNAGGTNPKIYWNLRRAPGFFDEVCYTGTGVATSQTHNLGVVPELIIVKGRSAAFGWATYSATLGIGYYLTVNNTAAAAADPSNVLWNNVPPTSTTFRVGTNPTVNGSGSTYVAYLFASCPGVSKVGSYTGTGATQTISCGFAARFVLIKRTDSTGDWFVWDTARGMVAGTDPRLALNSTAAETNANWVYTDASGFQIVTTDATVNASGGSYIFLAVG